MKRKLIAGAAAVAAVAGGGAVVATAATPEENDDAILSAVAKDLGVDENALESAVEKALAARIDAAVAAGELTSDQAEAFVRIDAEDDTYFVNKSFIRTVIPR